MRLHTSATQTDVWNATRQAGAHVEKLGVHRSTVRPHAFEVTLSGDGTRWANDGQCGRADYKAASWDQWGIVLAYLYERDPGMIVGTPGNPIYRDAEHFHAVTVSRYERGPYATPITSPSSPGYHANHAWNVPTRFRGRECKCGAQRDYGDL